jgi:hypothetical protein
MFWGTSCDILRGTITCIASVRRIVVLCKVGETIVMNILVAKR